MTTERAIAGQLCQAVAFSISFAACTLLVDTGDLAEPAASPGTPDASDAAAIGDATGDALVVEADASVDAEAGVDACAVQLPPTLVPLAPNWTLRGSATAGATDVVLVPREQEKAGALWWNQPLTFQRFEAAAKLVIDPAADPADGMTLAWTTGSSVPETGSTGGGLGAQGLTGYGVTVDVYGEHNGAVAPFVGVVDLTRTFQSGDWYLTARSLPAPEFFGKEHLLRARLDTGGVISVWFDGVLYVDKFTIPGFFIHTGYWGVTGGTGGSATPHHVRSASLLDLSKSPCP